MPVKLRKVEFLGGPWDGGFYLALDDEQRITVEGSGGIRQIAGLNKQQVMVVESIRNQLIQVAI